MSTTKERDSAYGSVYDRKEKMSCAKKKGNVQKKVINKNVYDRI